MERNLHALRSIPLQDLLCLVSNPKSERKTWYKQSCRVKVKLRLVQMQKTDSHSYHSYHSCSFFISVSHRFFISFLANPQRRNEYSVNDVERYWNWIISIKRLNCNRSFERPFPYSIVLPRIKTRNRLSKDKTIVETVKSSKVMDCKHWLLNQFRKN